MPTKSLPEKQNKKQSLLLILFKLIKKIMRIKHLDGLRAISLFSVLIYHAFPETFKNAYIGVDYFFVISGFIIAKKYIFDANNFNFILFIQKRFLKFISNK